MITQENLIQRVQLHDINNWMHKNASIRFQNQWDMFKREIQDGDEIWSYRLRKPERQGYCILRKGHITHNFQTASE